MACPTCGGDMQFVGLVQTTEVSWCPRCGTLQDESPTLPSLVERCRLFERDMLSGRPQGGRVGIADWHRLGIAESINPPGKRPNFA